MKEETADEKARASSQVNSSLQLVVLHQRNGQKGKVRSEFSQMISFNNEMQ